MYLDFHRPLVFALGFIHKILRYWWWCCEILTMNSGLAWVADALRWYFLWLQLHWEEERWTLDSGVWKYIPYNIVDREMWFTLENLRCLSSCPYPFAEISHKYKNTWFVSRDYDVNSNFLNVFFTATALWLLNYYNRHLLTLTTLKKTHLYPVVAPGGGLFHSETSLGFCRWTLRTCIFCAILCYLKTHKKRKTVDE